MREEEDVGDKQMRTWGAPARDSQKTQRGRDTKAKGEIRQTCREVQTSH